jgi:hypothetical protein
MKADAIKSLNTGWDVERRVNAHSCLGVLSVQLLPTSNTRKAGQPAWHQVTQTLQSLLAHHIAMGLGCLQASESEFAYVGEGRAESFHGTAIQVVAPAKEAKGGGGSARGVLVVITGIGKLNFVFAFVLKNNFSVQAQHGL